MSVAEGSTTSSSDVERADRVKAGRARTSRGHVPHGSRRVAVLSLFFSKRIQAGYCLKRNPGKPSDDCPQGATGKARRAGSTGEGGRDNQSVFPTWETFRSFMVCYGHTENSGFLTSTASLAKASWWTTARKRFPTSL